MPRWIDPVPALKRRVADEILLLLDGWTQEYAADFIRTTQPKVSELRRGHLERFSLDRLVRYLSRLHRDIEIVSIPRAGPSIFRQPVWPPTKDADGSAAPRTGLPESMIQDRNNRSQSLPQPRPTDGLLEDYHDAG
jgi:predicted XRE-type DNA-binding protein